MGVIYLDHLSGTPLHPRVKEAMINHINTVYGNPVSDHQVGQQAAQALDTAMAAPQPKVLNLMSAILSPDTLI